MFGWGAYREGAPELAVLQQCDLAASQLVAVHLVEDLETAVQVTLQLAQHPLEVKQVPTGQCSTPAGSRSSVWSPAAMVHKYEGK